MITLTNNHNVLPVHAEPVGGGADVLPEVSVGDVVDKEVVSVAPGPGGEPGRPVSVPDGPVVAGPDNLRPRPGGHRAGEDKLVAQPCVDGGVARPH